MGIRVHKMVGYGLTDVEENDERINWDSKVLKYAMHNEQHTHDYIEYYKAKHDSVCLDDIYIREIVKKGERIPRIQDAFQYAGGDFGMDNVFVVRPLTMTDWCRYDDTLDWIEETTGYDQQDRVQILADGPFPYNGLHMDARTGKRVKGDVNWWSRVSENPEYKDREDVLDSLAELFGMSHNEAKNNLVPFVPEDIRYLCEFAEVFTTDDVFRQLRPMIYTWWA